MSNPFEERVAAAAELAKLQLQAATDIVHRGGLVGPNSSSGLMLISALVGAIASNMKTEGV